MAKAKPKVASNTPAVNAYMETLDHPFKDEIQAVREIILNTHDSIMEQVKWNAPSFGTTDYMVTFSLHARDRVHLVFHNPHIASIVSPILEGDYKDRRMTYFANMDDIKAKQSELQRVILEVIARMND